MHFFLKKKRKREHIRPKKQMTFHFRPFAIFDISFFGPTPHDQSGPLPNLATRFQTFLFLVIFRWSLLLPPFHTISRLTFFSKFIEKYSTSIFNKKTYYKNIFNARFNETKLIF